MINYTGRGLLFLQCLLCYFCPYLAVIVTSLIAIIFEAIQTLRWL